MRPIDWLREEYNERRRRHPRYSLTAFSRHLGIPSGRLSELMSGKRRLTAKMAARIAERLDYEPERRDALLRSIQGATAKAPVYEPLETDVFHLIADWYHYGVLSLFETPQVRQDAGAVAARLSISTTEARTAVDRLLRLGLLVDRGGRLAQSGAPLTTTQDIPSVAVRRFHAQHLELAGKAMAEAPVDRRDLSGITMAIDPARLPEAKELIREFRRRMALLLEDGARTEVYHLAVQLYPLSEART